MNLPSFVNELLHEGRVQVDPVFDRAGRLVADDAAERHDAESLLVEFELQYRNELAFEPPGLSRKSLYWAARNIYRACSLLTYRDIEAERMLPALAERCPEPPTPSVVYSVDITYRFLPDLVRLARAASPSDPLVQALVDWARQWPLSSVGISGIEVTGPVVCLDDRCLRRMYIDRILSEQDESRLNDPRTLDAVRESVGQHRHLVPKLAARLAVQ